ncbi:hypothetical protein [Nonomuraea sp. LPB2021202275-12-8]|uniref:hypothetical protein n=1 Tax=Nonomuraea sp. LPB2021202275-12-8 TaxID=3120159 RepID=UPI00300D1695
MTTHRPEAGFLGTPRHTPEVQRLFDDDLADTGYVTNAARVWAYQPATHDALFELLHETGMARGLDERRRGTLIAACASVLGDAYCSLAWGGKLAGASDPRTAAGVLKGDDGGLTGAERAMTAWARKVARAPSATTGRPMED